MGVMLDVGLLATGGIPILLGIVLEGFEDLEKVPNCR
jgi:hypothetical protein